MPNEVSSDPEVFNQCTDTIIRQVGDIGRMVDEFSSFARMPAPVMRRELAQELVQQACSCSVPPSADRFRSCRRIAPDPIRLRRPPCRPGADQCAENAGEAIEARTEAGEEEHGRIANRSAEERAR